MDKYVYLFLLDSVMYSVCGHMDKGMLLLCLGRVSFVLQTWAYPASTEARYNEAMANAGSVLVRPAGDRPWPRPKRRDSPVRAVEVCVPAMVCVLRQAVHKAAVTAAAAAEAAAAVAMNMSTVLLQE